MASTPDKAAVIAEAYRRGLLPPGLAASYEAAARQGIVNDPYAAARAEGRGDPVTGYLTTAARAVPGVTELGAGWSAALRSADDLVGGRKPDFGARYSQARAQQQGLVDQFRADHPIASNNATALGTVAPMAATLPVGAAPAAVRLAAPAASRGAIAVAGRVAAGAARNAFTGGVIGATYGFGQGESLRDREANAARGFLPGAVAGAVTPMAVGAARGLLVRGQALAAGMRAGTGPFAVQLPMSPEVEPPARERWINHYAIDTRPVDEFDDDPPGLPPMRVAGGPPPGPPIRPPIDVSGRPSAANDNDGGLAGLNAAWSLRTARFDQQRANPAPVSPGQTPPDNVIAGPYAATPNNYRAPGTVERASRTPLAGGPSLAPGAVSIADQRPAASEGQPPAGEPQADGAYVAPASLGPLGDVMRASRIAAFNEKVINLGLAPLGETLPFRVGGQQAVDYLGARTAKAYDEAASRVKSFVKDPQLVAATQAGGAALAGATNKAREAYKAFLIAHVAPRISAGDMTGDDVLDMQSKIADWANRFKAYDSEIHPVGLVLDHLNNQVTDAVDRQNPGYGAAKRAADQAAAIHGRLVRAAGMAANTGGAFTPGQLTKAMDLEAENQGDVVTSANLFPLRALTRQAEPLIDSTDPKAIEHIMALSPRASPYRYTYPYQWSVRDLPVPANDVAAPNAFAPRPPPSWIGSNGAGQGAIAPSWITAGSYLAPPGGAPDRQ